MDSNLSEPAKKTLSGGQRLLEVGLIFTTVFAIFLVVALLTFDPRDPSWSQTGYHAAVNNAGGAIGAYLADVILFSFGRIAYTLPFTVALIGWLLFQRIRYLLEIDFFTLGLKFIGFLMLYIGLTSIWSMNSADIYEFSGGGLIGDLISNALLPYLNFVGTSLFVVLLTTSGFVFLTGVSFLTMIDWLGARTISAIMVLTSGSMRLKHSFSSSPLEIDVEESLVEESVKPRNSKRNKSKEQAPILESIDTDPMEPASLSPSDEELAARFFAPDPQQRSEFTQETEQEPFLDIDDILDEPLVGHIEPDISVDEIDAAFSPANPIEPFDDQPQPVAKQPLSAIPDPSAPTQAKSGFDKYVGMPSIELLDRADKNENPINQEELDMVSRLVESKLLDFSIQAQVVNVFPGPVITRFELDLAPGVKVSKISNLSKDLARALSAISVRVVEVIPGKSVIGLELPNKHREIVRLSEVICSDSFTKSASPLTMVLGKDIAGDPIVVDLAKMPHLLVAGTTGSGKSVGVNTMILSLLYKSTPEDVRLIMIDPKMLELSVYEGIPHLLAEVVTDMKEAANALRWCVGEMERRYKLMSAMGVRNLKGFNQKVKQAIAEGSPLTDPLWKPGDSMDETAPLLEKLPAIVVVVDEFADMIMIVGKKVEELIARIAQKARAAGIHLILATQRPSVDVITGLIKANIPTRMAFQVSSRVDSRTILDQQGAEQLLGQGDMLYLPPGTGVPTRVHGAFVDDHEVHAVVNDWKARGKPNYIEEILSGETNADNLLPGEQSETEESDLDALYDEALVHVTETRRASISGVQRKFRIGYNRAARIIEQMEASGVVSSPGHNGNREVLAPPPVKN
ncbi:cell division protein FtsK [Thalassotalea litorea]|uniref:DNA translocase FtsK n=1 Tax=Thalassotalea litorea TaxID=2020715 RepID=A0A5R9ISK0_9GAMM|nr:DNA translocase FtsK 4TM domain-containing protein [Thalassotalea litorea]TLU66271.1 cell division protein FtsK [Thalassotalea litorea]